MNSRSGSPLSRRTFIGTVGAAGALSALGGLSPVHAADAAPESFPRRPGRLKQGVCRGVFKGVKLDPDAMCREAAKAGAWGIDLVGPDFFPSLKKYGLIPTMVPGGSGIKAGINDPKHHAEIEPKMRAALKVAAEARAPNVIVLAGDRAGISDEQGLDTCVAFLNRVKAQAEDLGVTLCTELLNSKVNHPGYMADRTAWGVEMCKRVNSPRVKLLYDIYHMQIMEGDLIRTIRENIAYIGHFHTAGNPGRNEFDESQEIYYPPICRAIADLGFDGYLSHEYTPTRDALAMLERMMKTCEA
jgi:hydroxypyruvate isomerase